MHELSIAMSLVEMATERARRAGSPRVTRLNLRVGVLRSVEDEAMRMAFEAARGDSSCRDAELCIERIPIRGRCGACGVEYGVQQDRWDCPVCGAEGELLEGGDELELASIEIED
jgi:hydrogenase nickel incorporation protein HypA/HybF